MTRRMLRLAEGIALATTALAFAITVLLVTTGAAAEVNPAAAGLLDAMGWSLTGVLAIAVEAACFALLARRRDRYPRVTLAGGGVIAAVGVADLALNLWLLARTGLPDAGEFHAAKYALPVALVGVAALLAFVRPDPRAVVGRVPRPSTAQRRVAGAVLLAVLLAVAGMPADMFGPGAPGGAIDVVNASDHEDSDDVLDDAEDNDMDEWTIGSGWTDASTSTSAAYEGDYGIVFDSSGGGSKAILDITNDSYSSISHWKNIQSCGSHDMYFYYDDPSGTHLFKYQMTDTCTIRVSGSSWIDTGISLNTDQWYKIKFTNIDYSNNEVDLVVEFANGSVHGTQKNFGFENNGNKLGRYRAYESNGAWKAYVDFIAVNNQTVTYPIDGYVKETDGDAINNINVSINASGVSDNVTTSDGFYKFSGLSDGDYKITAGGSGTDYDKNSTTATVSGSSVSNVNLSLVKSCKPTCGSKYNQEFAVTDHTDQELDSTDSHLSSWYVKQVVEGGGEFPLVNPKWVTEDEKYLNHNSRATHVLDNGTTYKLVLNNWATHAHYEEIGWVADRDHGTYNITIGSTTITEHINETELPSDVDPYGDADGDGLLNVEEGGADFDDDGVPNYLDEDADGDGTLDGDDSAYQDELGEVMGPTVVGTCTLATGDEGVSVEYWDPSYSTSEFDYTVQGPDGAVYEGQKEFDRDIGYWRGCVGSEMLNGTAPGNANVSWNATRGGQEINGSSSVPAFSDVVGGPVGNAPDSPAGQAAVFGGLGAALAALYVGGRRVGPNTTTIPRVGEIGVPPAFAVGAPIVGLVGLDLAGGGVISFATGTVISNIGPIAGIAGIAGVGYLFYQRFIASGGGLF